MEMEISKSDGNGPRPRSFQHAMELCLQFALEQHNLDVESIADRMGLANHWTLYGWMESGQLPCVSIRPFELACGADYITQWICASAGKLVFQTPTGVSCGEAQIGEIQTLFSDAMANLISFYRHENPAEEAIEAINAVILGLIWQRENVAHLAQLETARDDTNDDPAEKQGTVTRDP